MKGYSVEFYTKPDGTKPVAEFIMGLTDKLKAKTLRSIQLLQEVGPLLREPDSKSLGNGIFELRVQQKNDAARILYFFFDEKRIILTNGFVKKTQKTPPDEIEKAKKYRAEFLSRKENKK